MHPDVSKIEALKGMLQNPVFLTAIASFVISQFVKGVVVLVKNFSREKRRSVITAFIWNTGGIPSSHSALVSTIAASSAIYEGFGSVIFVVTLFYAFIIMRDALGVRRSTGLQAKALNELGKTMEEKLNIPWKPVKEVEGHSPLEVVTGALFGVCVSLIFAYFDS